jgi:hypothetical protein
MKGLKVPPVRVRGSYHGSVRMITSLPRSLRDGYRPTRSHSCSSAQAVTVVIAQRWLCTAYTHAIAHKRTASEWSGARGLRELAMAPAGAGRLVEGSLSLWLGMVAPPSLSGPPVAPSVMGRDVLADGLYRRGARARRCAPEVAAVVRTGCTAASARAALAYGPLPSGPSLWPWL